MLERFFCYVPSPDRVTLAASQLSYDNRIPIRQNADFYLRAFAALSSGALAWRARRADSSWFTGALFNHLSGFCVTTGAARWTPIYPQIVYPKSSAFVYDLQELAAATEPDFYPMLIGVERYADGAIPGPALPAQYVEYDYEISMPTQTITGLGTQLLDIPIRCKTGEPFIVRSMAWRFNEATGAPQTLHVRLRDEYGRAFSNDFVPLRLLMAGPTEVNAPYLATPFPEMVIPANGQYTIDLWNRNEAGPFTVDITFKGVRLGAVEAQG